MFVILLWLKYINIELVEFQNLFVTKKYDALRVTRFLDQGFLKDTVSLIPPLKNQTRKHILNMMYGYNCEVATMWQNKQLVLTVLYYRKYDSSFWA